MKLTTTRRLTSRITAMLAKTTLSIITVTGVIGVSRTHPAIATPPPQQSPILVATAHTNLTLPTLRRGDHGTRVRMLQQILSDNGFLNAAGVRLGNPSGAVVDGAFGAITESAVRDLQHLSGDRVSRDIYPAAPPQPGGAGRWLAHGVLRLLPRHRSGVGCRLVN